MSSSVFAFNDGMLPISDEVQLRVDDSVAWSVDEAVGMPIDWLVDEGIDDVLWDEISWALTGDIHL